MADIPGIDASRHQGTIIWPQVAAAGFVFAFLKATDGVRYSYTQWFHINAAEADAAGLIVGAYHFLLDHHPGDAQARFFVNEVSSQFPGFVGVVPIVDIEREADGTTPRIEHLRAFVAEFKRLVPGRAILIYTGRWYWVGVIGNPFGADLGPLWHSEYDGISPIDFDVANGPELDAYGGWTHCEIWQHTSSGQVPGVSGNCDRNLSYIPVEWLLDLAGLTPQPTPPQEEDDDMPYYIRNGLNGAAYRIGVGAPFHQTSISAYQADLAVLRQVNYPNGADCDTHLAHAVDEWATQASLLGIAQDTEAILAELTGIPVADTVTDPDPS